MHADSTTAAAGSSDPEGSSFNKQDDAEPELRQAHVDPNKVIEFGAQEHAAAASPTEQADQQLHPTLQLAQSQVIDFAEKEQLSVAASPDTAPPQQLQQLPLPHPSSPPAQSGFQLQPLIVPEDSCEGKEVQGGIVESPGAKGKTPSPEPASTETAISGIVEAVESPGAKVGPPSLQSSPKPASVETANSGIIVETAISGIVKAVDSPGIMEERASPQSPPQSAASAVTPDSDTEEAPQLDAAAGKPPPLHQGLHSEESPVPVSPDKIASNTNVFATSPRKSPMETYLRNSSSLGALTGGTSSATNVSAASSPRKLPVEPSLRSSNSMGSLPVAPAARSGSRPGSTGSVAPSPKAPSASAASATGAFSSAAVRGGAFSPAAARGGRGSIAPQASAAAPAAKRPAASATKSSSSIGVIAGFGGGSSPAAPKSSAAGHSAVAVNSSGAAAGLKGGSWGSAPKTPIAASAAGIGAGAGLKGISSAAPKQQPTPPGGSFLSKSASGRSLPPNTAAGAPRAVSSALTASAGGSISTVSRAAAAGASSKAGTPSKAAAPSPPPSPVSTVDSGSTGVADPVSPVTSAPSTPVAARTPSRLAAASPAAGALFGEWRLVRLKKAVPCDACHGTVERKSLEGGKGAFSCDVTLQPGEGRCGGSCPHRLCYLILPYRNCRKQVGIKPADARMVRVV